MFDPDSEGGPAIVHIDRAVGADRRVPHITAFDNAQKPAVMDCPSIIAAVFGNIDMVKLAVSVDVQIRNLRIRGKKRSVFVKEYAVRTVQDVG